MSVRRIAAFAAFCLGAIALPLLTPAAAQQELHPATAAGCSETTAIYTQPTDVAISSAGTPTVTSNLNVAGAGAHLRDLDVLTSITHTFAADLEITLTSPAGTIVTLTTENGGQNDNVFNGTRWDDDGGTPVTDATFANNVVETPIVPEDSLSAFRGENPNGTWVLRIHDNANQDGGTLTEWSLDLSTQSFGPSFTTKKVANNVPTSLPGGIATTNSTISVSGAAPYVFDVNLTTFITHTFAGDLDITLISPAGTQVTITTDNGEGANDVFNGTRWDDQVDPGSQVPYGATNPNLVTDRTFANNVVVPKLVPEEAMGAFLGENPNGTWTLRVADDMASDSGTLNRWNLNLLSGDCRPRPDGRIQRGAGALVGNNTYNNSGVMQTREGQASRGNSVTYTISVQNDAKFADEFELRGQPSTTQYQVVYRTTGGANITSQVVGGTYSTGSLAPGATHNIRAVVTVKNNAQPGSRATRTVKITSVAEPARLDVVRFITRRA